jgi:hypothetical protein
MGYPKVKCYDCEQIFRVGYILGKLSEKIEAEFGDKYIDIDMDKLFEIAQKINNDWDNFVDMQDGGEEGYIQEYAQRKWREEIKKYIDKLGECQE